jgi:hypothetical protein
MPPGRGAEAVEHKALKLTAGGVHSQPGAAELAKTAAGLDRQGAKAGAEEAVWRANLRGDASLVGRRADSWWTGVRPAECAGAQADGTLTSLPLPVRARFLRFMATRAAPRAAPRAVYPLARAARARVMPRDAARRRAVARTRRARCRGHRGATAPPIIPESARRAAGPGAAGHAHRHARADPGLLQQHVDAVGSAVQRAARRVRWRPRSALVLAMPCRSAPRPRCPACHTACAGPSTAPHAAQRPCDAPARTPRSLR